MTNTNAFRQMVNQTQFSRVSSYTITHPKREGHAVINVAYPKDGAGRLTVYVRDCFGEQCTTTRGTAGGYGYDKFTAALSEHTIDGHLMSDHATQDSTSKRLLKAYGKARLAGEDGEKVRTRAKKLGYFFTNWSEGGGYQPNGWNGWQSCYRGSGLELLRTLGYRIIQAI